MKEVNYVFGALEEPDVEALMRIGTQQQLHVSERAAATYLPVSVEIVMLDSRRDEFVLDPRH